MSQELINVFVDTKNRFENIKTNTKSTKHTTKEALFTLDGKKSKVIVINSDTVSAGVLYSLLGKTCILNMASYKRPGGGVARGAKAQEECLFRCSNLYTISEDLYPLKDDEAIYSKDVVFIKDKYYQPMKPVTLDVITIAAVNLNGRRKPENYKEIMMKKILLMFTLAKQNGCKNIILGAWGCGVFKNDIDIIKKLINEHGFIEMKSDIQFSVFEYFPFDENDDTESNSHLGDEEILLREKYKNYIREKKLKRLL
jgi:uncharacterized protein (TIGR02452 family)